MRFAEAAEQDSEHRVGVGRRTDGGPRVRSHALLVDDDGGGETVHDIDFRTRQGGHEPLQESAVGLVDHALRFGSDGAEHQRTLARTRNAGEHREPALRDLHADVFEIVHPSALHADQVVGVGDVRFLRLRFLGGGHAAPVSICWRDVAAERRLGLVSYSVLGFSGPGCRLRISAG